MFHFELKNFTLFCSNTLCYNSVFHFIWLCPTKQWRDFWSKPIKSFSSVIMHIIDPHHVFISEDCCSAGLGFTWGTYSEWKEVYCFKQAANIWRRHLEGFLKRDYRRTTNTKFLSANHFIFFIHIMGKIWFMSYISLWKFWHKKLTRLKKC